MDKREGFTRPGRLAALPLLCAILTVTARAQDEDSGGWSAGADFETKIHYRNSDDNRFPVNFPFTPDMLPPGQTQGFLRTVDPGGHLEASILSLYTDVRYDDWFAVHGKFDFFDLHDRNPTSGDRRLDVDQAWVRIGRETAPATLADGFGGYARIGKFGKFERQDDRHLESYGVVSTAFNRFEDLGVELGADLGRNFYLKGSLTQGNPLFFRDPNALAGDNGTEVFLTPNPVPEFNNGIPIIYDAEVEGIDTGGNTEVGAAAGYRWADEAGRRAFDVMVFGYRRELEESVSLKGTFYGADLDFLRGPGNAFPYPGLSGDDKEEYGINVRAYIDDLTIFAQYVDQEIASLPRKGLELEVAWRFELPLVWAWDGRQVFSHIQPAIRYSRLENDFANPAVTPFPSGVWDWEKIDIGVRLEILPGLDLTAEYADNTFATAGGDADNDEWLLTLRWRI